MRTVCALPRTAGAVFVHAIYFFFKLHGIQNREMLNAVQGCVITFSWSERLATCVVCFDF